MKTRLLNNWFAGLAAGLLLAVSALGWAGPPWGPGGIKGALKACEAALATCEERSFQMPGDGQTGAPLAYQDNGDGTFTDLNTGLMWDIKTYDGSIHDVDNGYTWSTWSDGDPSDRDGTAFTVFLAALNTPPGFAGYTDWRLPTVKELQSLVDYSVPSPGPAVSGALPGATAYDYWSDTFQANSQGSDDDNTYAYAWAVAFSYGWVYGEGTNSDIQVRAVRGGW
jgi:Protein of unknown function (DUF1566)